MSLKIDIKRFNTDIELIEGLHYYGLKGITSPILTKAGAEVIMKKVDLTTQTEFISTEIKDNTQTLIVRTSIHTPTGNYLGDGFGGGVVSLQNDLDFNTTVKMAKKRSYVDAVISTFHLSNTFTQDLEENKTMMEKVVTLTPTAKGKGKTAKQVEVEPTPTVPSPVVEQVVTPVVFPEVVAPIAPVFDMSIFGQTSAPKVELISALEFLNNMQTQDSTFREKMADMFTGKDQMTFFQNVLKEENKPNFTTLSTNGIEKIISFYGITKN